MTGSAAGRVSANGASAPSIVERTVEVRKEPVALKSFDEWRKTEKGTPFWRCACAVASAHCLCGAKADASPRQAKSLFWCTGFTRCSYTNNRVERAVMVVCRPDAYSFWVSSAL